MEEGQAVWMRAAATSSPPHRVPNSSGTGRWLVISPTRATLGPPRRPRGCSPSSPPQMSFLAEVSLNLSSPRPPPGDTGIASPSGLASSRHQHRDRSYPQTGRLLPWTFWSPAPRHPGWGRGKGVCLLVWSGRGKGSRGDGEGRSMMARGGSGAKVVGFQLSTASPFSTNPQEKCHRVVQRRKLFPQEAKQLAQDQDRGAVAARNTQLCKPPPSLSPHLPLQPPVVA